jgi:hypothetical protein
MDISCGSFGWNMFLGFWSPNFNSKPAHVEHEVSVARPVQKSVKHDKKRCGVMQALQRSFSEAQKLNCGVDTLRTLIKLHKSSCPKCRSVSR